ncbi:Primosomal protein N' (replication factor Y) - superfamily II helicase [Streptococcus constellatus]|nr:Primosomal protein N' (replication factor Y) - superfamily II helicase [Streptococcus constellatus]
MESIEPFDFSEAVDFQTAYLAGYLADKYDVGAEESITHANSRVKQSTEEAFEDTVTGFSAVTPESSNVRLINGSTKYVLYPVWLLNTTWRGKKFVFAMNGQTGKFVGDLPLDKQAYRRWLIGLGVAASLVSYAAVWMIHLL